MIRAVVFDWGDTVMRDFREFEAPMAHWPRVEAVAGAEGALRALRPRHRLALATNAALSDEPLVRAALARAGLDAYFERVFVSSELGVEKPDLRFFAAVLDGLSLRAEEVVMVGDSYANDIRGGHRAGLLTVWLNPQARAVPSGAQVHNAEVAHLDELPAAIAGLALA